MPLGPVLRRALGPLEQPAAALYRSVFIDLDAFVAQVALWAGRPRSLLELGCGEGAVVDRLADTFPAASVTGIDITPRIGRLSRAADTRVAFRQITMKDYAAEHPGAADLLVACDVLHHVPWEMHEEILRDAGRAVRAGGCIVIKDWTRQSTPIHLLCYMADRYITGDRVRYKTGEELEDTIMRVFGPHAIEARARIAPWTNNIAYLVRIPAEPESGLAQAEPTGS
jgi:SAM-dependent methyltransferase